ncbi:MAG: Arm DNA-binding domain-containing protein [Gammaproteobacteria bacterium]|nr:Arm DNA-binding domain-containing protein [Gammaproteobacteria bacterium]
MVAKRLTVVRIRAFSEPGMYRADPTFCLRVGPTGAKSWFQRLTIDGRRRDIGLGGLTLVSLAEARETAFDNRRHARR